MVREKSPDQSEMWLAGLRILAIVYKTRPVCVAVFLLLGFRGHEPIA